TTTGRPLCRRAMPSPTPGWGSRACGSASTAATAARPSNWDRRSRASTIARTRSTRCSGARRDSIPSAPSRRCATSMTSTAPSTTPARPTGNSSATACTRDPAGRGVAGAGAAGVAELDAAAIFAGGSGPARRLRALVDPTRLVPSVELETERRIRLVRRALMPWPEVEFVVDVVTVRSTEAAPVFRELALRRLPWGTVGVARLGTALADRHGLHRVATDRRARAAELLAALETGALARSVQGQREVAIIAV